MSSAAACLPFSAAITLPMSLMLVAPVAAMASATAASVAAASSCRGRKLSISTISAVSFAASSGRLPRV
jgi:hypothetical protein